MDRCMLAAQGILNYELSHGLLCDPCSKENATDLPQGVGIGFGFDATTKLLNREGMVKW